jgi:hypothetical protein
MSDCRSDAVTSFCPPDLVVAVDGPHTLRVSGTPTFPLRRRAPRNFRDLRQPRASNRYATRFRKRRMHQDSPER